MTTYHVKADGSDGASGSLSNPFLTGAYALGVASQGDTILFNGGDRFASGSALVIPVHELTIGQYGSGFPVIRNTSGNVATGSWTETPGASGNYFWSYTSTAINGFYETDTDGANPVFLKHVDTYADLTGAGEVFWDKNDVAGNGVGAGVYWRPTGGTPDSRLFYRSNTGNIIQAINKDGLVLDGIKTDLGVVPLSYQATTRNCAGLRIQNCDFRNCARMYIHTDDTYKTSDVIISDNAFTDVLSGAVFFDGTSNGERFSDLQVLNNTITGINANNSWGYFRAVTGASQDIEGIGTQNVNDTLIAGNTIKNGTPSANSYGAIIHWQSATGTCKRNIIRQNYISGIDSGYGILIGAGNTEDIVKDNTIHSNIVIGESVSGSRGIIHNGDSSDSSNKILNNSMFYCDRSIDIGAYGSGLVIEQNLSYEPTYHIYNDKASYADTLSDSNCWYKATVGNDWYWNAGAVNYSTWQTNTSNSDTNPVTTPPLVMNNNPANAVDCTPRANSPLLDIATGTNNALVDYNGVTPTETHIGAISTAFVRTANTLNKTSGNRR